MNIWDFHRELDQLGSDTRRWSFYSHKAGEYILKDWRVNPNLSGSARFTFGTIEAKITAIAPAGHHRWHYQLLREPRTDAKFCLLRDARAAMLADLKWLASRPSHKQSDGCAA